MKNFPLVVTILIILFPISASPAYIDLLQFEIGKKANNQLNNALRVGNSGISKFQELSVNTDNLLISAKIEITAKERWARVLHPVTREAIIPEATKIITSNFTYDIEKSRFTGDTDVEIGIVSDKTVGEVVGKKFEINLGKVSIEDQLTPILDDKVVLIKDTANKYLLTSDQDLLASKAAKKIKKYLEENLKFGNKGKTELVKLSLDVKNYKIQGTGNIIVHHSWGKFNVPNITISNPFGVREVEISLKESVTCDFSYDLQSGRMSGDVTLHDGISWTPKNPITQESLSVFDTGPITVDLNRLERAIDGDLTAIVELIPNPAPNVVRRDVRTEYEPTRQGQFDKHGGGANVYFSSKAFVDWANPSKIAVWAGEAIFTAGTATPAIMKEISSQALREMPGVYKWLAEKAVVEAASTAEGLLSGNKPDWPFLSFELTTVKYESRPVLFDKPIGPWFGPNHLAFLIVWKGNSQDHTEPSHQSPPREPTHDEQATQPDTPGGIHGQITTNLNIEILPNNSFELGEAMLLKVSSNKSGQLLVYDLNANNQLQQIFPNNYTANRRLTNRMASGETITIPDAYYGFQFEAVPPLGNGRIIAILVEDSVHLEDIANIEQAFKTLSPDVDILETIRERLVGKRSNWSLAVAPYEIR